jgi:hypothetical protein
VAEVARPVIRAVLDTNVLVLPGLRRDLQNAAQEGAFTAIWSPWIIAELNRVLTWKWLERTATSSAARNVICDLSPANWQRCSMAATAMMEILLATFELVNPRPPYPETWDTLADVQDVPIWVAAVEGRKAGPSTSFRTTGATTRRSKRMAGTSIRASNTSVAQTSSAGSPTPSWSGAWLTPSRVWPTWHRACWGWPWRSAEQANRAGVVIAVD